MKRFKSNAVRKPLALFPHPLTPSPCLPFGYAQGPAWRGGIILLVTFLGLACSAIAQEATGELPIIPPEMEQSGPPILDPSGIPQAGTAPLPVSSPPRPLGSPRTISERKPSKQNELATKKNNINNPGSKSIADAKTLPADTTGWLNLDYVNEPILDVLRSIATAYRLSIIPEKEIEEVKITIHLEKIPVMEGLEKLCRAHGLELIREGNVLRVRKFQEAEQSLVQLRGGKLFLDVKNKPIREFLRDFGEKTGFNIVPDQGLRGTVTGQLRGVTPLDGLKALMSANKFELRLRSGVYLVGNENPSENPNNMGMGRRAPGGMNASGSGEVDVHDGKVTLNAKNSPLADLIREIAEQSATNFSVIGEVNGTVNAQMKDVSVDDALNNILSGTRFTFIRKNGSLLFGDRNPNTPSGQTLSSQELIFLKFIRADNLSPLLPKTIG